MWAHTACSTGGGPLDPSTGVEVQVLKGPIQPVVREGERDTAPVAGAVVVIRTSGRSGTSRAATDSAGVARVPVPPGIHVVTVETCPGTMSLPKESQTVSVTPGTYASTTLVCDTGIR